LEISYLSLVKKQSAAKEKVDAYGDGIKQAFQDIAQETSKVEILVTALKREKLSRDERKGAIEELQRIAPAYFGTLDKEKFTIDQLIVSYGNYARSLRTAAEAKGLEKQLDAIIERRFEIDKILNPPQFTFDDKGNRIQNFLLDNVATQRVRKQLQSEYNGLLRAEEVLAQRIAQLKPPDLIKPSIEKPKSGKEDNFSFLFDFLPFNPAGNLKDEQRSKLFDSIQKFQKEFRGILKGINFTGSEDQVIQQALKFDVKLKAGKVEFDTKALSDSIHNSLRPEDLLPKGTIDEVAKGATDLFIKTFQLQSENIKDAKLFGDLTLLPTIDKAIEDAKLDLKRVGLELPKTFQGKDPFGNPVQLKFSDLFDYHKIAPGDAIAAILAAVAKVKSATEQMQEELQGAFQGFKADAFAGLGESIGQAITSGGNFIDIAARSFTQTLGNFVELIGKDLIKFGVAKAALDKVLASVLKLPGAAIIGIGVATVAIGALIKSSFGNLKSPIGLNKGGIVPGQGNTDSVPALLTPGELVIPKDQVAKVQKLLKESVSFKLPTNIFGSLGLSDSFNKIKNLANFSFNIPQLSIPRIADVQSPLSKTSFALAGSAIKNQGQQKLVAQVSGRDLKFILAQEGLSQNRNFGRS
jgi:hypothetical protein